MSDIYESLLKDIPEDCVNYRKQFEACKENTEQFDTYNKPLLRTKHCRTHWLEYANCVDKFQLRYMQLKNLAARKDNLPEPYNIEDEINYKKENVSKLNFGLDKF